MEEYTIVMMSNTLLRKHITIWFVRFHYVLYFNVFDNTHIHSDSHTFAMTQIFMTSSTKLAEICRESPLLLVINAYFTLKIGLKRFEMSENNKCWQMSEQDS